MFTTSQHKHKGDGTLHPNSTDTELAFIAPDSQVSRPAVAFDRLVELGRELLEALGEDASRPGLQETPERFARWWREFMEYDAGKTDTLFESSTGQMVMVGPLRVWSICEHHLLPFWCDVTISYIPNGNVLGLSKFARIAHDCAHHLQLQERLVAQIAETVGQNAGTPDVMVMGQGMHLCMVMRGIQTPGLMTSVTACGRFETEPHLRAEFLQLASSNSRDF